MIQNGTKTDHLEHLGGPGTEMYQNGTKTHHLEHLGEVEQNRTHFLTSGALEAGSEAEHLLENVVFVVEKVSL